MYKTIRHGENSLQYTILPQNDDFRIEGKLTSASSSGSNGKVKSRRSARRRSFFAYLGLMFVCAVIIGAILVPFLVSAECLPSPSDWFLKTKVALTGNANQFSATSSSVTTSTHSLNTTSTTDARNNNKHSQSTIQPYPVGSSSTVVPPVSNLQIDIGGTSDASVLVNTETSTTIENRQTEISESQISNDFVAEVRFEGLGGQMVADVTPTIVVTTVRYNDQNKPELIERRNNVTITSPIISTMRPNGASIVSNITGRIMQVPLLKSAAKKPIIPPVLAKTNSLGRETIQTFHRDEGQRYQENIKKDQKEPSDWIRSHWPYIDPSTYFQWTGYKAEDSVILPAILGCALIVVILIIALFFIVRNKRTIVNSVRKRNRNDIEEAGEDNKTLLTNSNLSDDD